MYAPSSSPKGMGWNGKKRGIVSWPNSHNNEEIIILASMPFRGPVRFLWKIYEELQEMS